MFEHTNREFPIYFAFPFQKVDDISIALPLGWQVGSVPKPADQDGKAVQYTLTAEGDKTGLHVKRKVRTDLYLVPMDKYSALRSFYQIVRSGDEQQIVLQQGAAAASK